MVAHVSGDGGGPVANCHVVRLAYGNGEFAELD
jgi:hypothetical protein